MECSVRVTEHKALTYAHTRSFSGCDVIEAKMANKYMCTFLLTMVTYEHLKFIVSKKSYQNEFVAPSRMMMATTKRR